MKQLLTRQKSNEKELDKIKVQEPAAGGGSGAPTDAQYLTLATDGGLSDERVLTAGNGLSGTDAGAGSTYTLAVNVDDATIEINSDTLRVKDGGISSTKLADGAALAEILDDDGTGSGLDADLLDGSHASAFAAASHTHSKIVAADGSPDPALSADNAGDLSAVGNFSLASTKDIFPDADGGGLFQRNVNHWFTPTDHFNTFSGWTWSAVAPHDGAPETVDVATYLSILRLRNDDTSEDHFAYVTATGSTSLIAARLSKGVSSYVGIRLDDGSDDNYFEVRLVDASVVAMLAAEVKVRAGGGAVSTTTTATPLPPAFYIVRIGRTTTATWAGFSYLVQNTPIPISLGVGTGSVSWVPSRCGIIFGQRTAASNNDRVGLYDWFVSN